MAQAVSEDSERTICGDANVTADLPQTPQTPPPKLTDSIELSPAQSLYDSHVQKPQPLSLGRTDSPHAPHERCFGLPPIRPISPLSGPRPQHQRRHSSLRNEYHPISPSKADIQYGTASSDNVLSLERWTSLPSGAVRLQPSPMAETYGSLEPAGQFYSDKYVDTSVPKYHVNIHEYPTFTQNNGVLYEEYSSDSSFASPLNSFAASPSNVATSNYNLAPLSFRSSHVIPQSRERSASAPMAPLSSIELQPPMTLYQNVKVNGGHIQEQKHGLFSPDIPALTQQSHTMSTTSPSPRPNKKQNTTVSCEEAISRDEYHKSLIDAMQDMADTQDNPGILDTWRKLMKGKKSKIERVCGEMTDKLIKVANQNGEPLSEKKQTFVYHSFQERFNALCKALKSQKTMCKHLLEDPYMYQVIDDPIQALKRVQNNRRVNQQKKEAIEEGRKRLGVRGRGKGVALQRTLSTGSQSELDDDELSTRELSSERESEYATPPKNERPRRAATKRQYNFASDEEDADESVEAPTPPKKTRRNTHGRSKSAIEVSRPLNQKPTLIGSSNDAFTSPFAANHSYPYAPTAARHSTESVFRPGYSMAHPGNNCTSYNDFNYSYNGLPTQAYSGMRPPHIGGTPVLSPTPGLQAYQPSSSDTYSEIVTPENSSPCEQNHFDPYIA